MNQEIKLSLLENIMDLDEGTLTADTVLADLDEWDSLSVLSFVALMDEQFSKNIAGKDALACNTVGELMAMMEKQ